jgi:hypothetical protein
MKVPRQCPLVLLVEILHMIGISVLYGSGALRVKHSVVRGISVPTRFALGPKENNDPSQDLPDTN